MSLQRRGYLIVLALGFAKPALGDDPAARGDEPATFAAIDLSTPLAPATLAERLADKRVVFVGETHTRYADHLNQLEIIEQIYERDPNIAIGVEYLQERFQPQVDAYIAGQTSEQDFLRDAEYYRGWGYDYRLYAPIFRYAREHRIPVRALNVPSSLPPAVAKVGFDGLSEEQRAELPGEIEPAGAAYERRLREAFDAHPGAGPGAFEHFVQAQLVWDEGMAESAAAYLDANPDRRMIILAGSGHIAFGSGIPERLQRRTGATYAIVLNRDDEIEPQIADYVLLGDGQALPPAAVLGISLDQEDGSCRIGSLSPGGAAQKSGLRKGDVIVAIDGQACETVADLRLATWDKAPGEHVRVEVRRKRPFKTVEHDFELELATAHGSR